jgi:hypothetical protein
VAPFGAADRLLGEQVLRPFIMKIGIGGAHSPLCAAPHSLPDGRIMNNEHHGDAGSAETDSPDYDLPPLLVSADGMAIKNPHGWFRIRRSQVMSLFANLIYGAVPNPELPIRTSVDVLNVDRQFMNGRATRKEVRIAFENSLGKAEMIVLVFSPNGTGEPAPALLQFSFFSTQDESHDPEPNSAGFLRNGVPLGAILDHGFGYVAVHQADLVRHNEVEFTGGIHRLFYRGQIYPRAYEWGVVSAIAWSGSRAMDYIETDPDLDAKRVAVMGHSKCGKAALWTVAQDLRFGLAIAAQSGCAGAALWRRRRGETMEKLITRLPHWLCRNAWKFINNEDDVPVDQHMLLACIAPRPVYVCSAVEDTWADPRGEYLSAYYAGEVYRLLGRKALESIESPPVGEAIIKSHVGYHIRAGGHSVDLFDWERFLDFADYHFKQAGR